MSSVGECNVQYSIDGLRVVEDCLPTVIDPTKQSLLSTINFWGSRGCEMVAKPKEGGVRVCVAFNNLILWSYTV